jgi:MFS family permease
LWAFSFGVNAPLASTWMHAHGSSDTLVGLNTGCYYLGIALAAALTPWAMRRLGWVALAAGMLGSAVTAAAFPWGGGLPGWFLCRALNGGAGALSLIPLETYVNRTSDPRRRALFIGCYAFCVALGMGLGNLVAMRMAAHQPRTAFLLAGLAALAGAGVVALWRPAFLEEAKSAAGRTPLHFRRNFLAFGSAWTQGFMEGGMVGLLPIYLLALGLSRDRVGDLMGGLMVGVILAQAPVAWLADRLGRAAMLCGCNVLALVGIACLTGPGGTAWLAGWLFVVGACSGAFYPLGLALLGERTPPADLARAGSWFLAINCLGSLTGPVVAGAAMDLFGRGALFVSGGAAVALVLGLWLVSLAFAGRARPVVETEAAPARAAA